MGPAQPAEPTTSALDILTRLQAAAPHRLTGTVEAEAVRTWILQYLRDQSLEPVSVDFEYRTPGWPSRLAMWLNAWLTLTLGFLATTVIPWFGLAALAVINLVDFSLAPKIGRTRLATGTNVLVGLNRPWLEIVAERRPLVIVTAHTDTARAEPIWMRALLTHEDTAYSLAAIGLILLIAYWLTTGVLGLWVDASQLVGDLQTVWEGVGRWAMVALCLPIALSVSLGMLRGWFERGLVNPGADDNGSGVAVALDLIPALRSGVGPSSLDIALALVDAEEVGLRGARDVIERFGAVMDRERTTIVNLDCVGRGDTLISVSGQGLIRQRRPDPALLALWSNVATPLSASQAAIWMTFFSGGTDQAAWLSRGFRRTLSISHGTVSSRRLRAAVYRGFGIVADPVDSVWTHLHSPADTLAGISLAALAETSRAVAAFIRSLETQRHS